MKKRKKLKRNKNNNNKILPKEINFNNLFN